MSVTDKLIGSRGLSPREISDTHRIRFRAKYVKTRTGARCWVWKKPQLNGYAKFCFDGQVHQAARVAWAIHRGPVPPGLSIDHLCRNPSCVNPGHLEMVTLGENLRRVPSSPSTIIRESGRCKRGHDMALPDAWRYNASNGKRCCRLCQLERVREGHRRRAALQLEEG